MNRFKVYTCFSIFLVISLLLFPGCAISTAPQSSDLSPSSTTDIPSSQITSNVDSSKIVITAFTASPSTIGSNGSAKLSWNVSGASQVNIDHGIGDVGVSGEVTVSPTNTTIYTLIAKNSVNAAVANTQVTVTSESSSIISSGLPVIHLFTAQPESINYGESSTINWSVSNASSITINPTIFRQLGPIPAQGEAHASPHITTSYNLNASNVNGSVNRTITVIVNSVSTTPQYSDWSGTWDTDWGTMNLLQSEGKVTGTYEHDKGKILGYISKNLTGNILVGTWSESPSYEPPNDAGDIEWIMAPDFNSFTGKWRYGSSGEWDGSWAGKRVTP